MAQFRPTSHVPDLTGAGGAPHTSSMAKGKFITLEGGEGVGKSTQAALLQAALKRRGIEAVITREPGGTPFAEAVRDFILHGSRSTPATPLAETLMFFAARADHVSELIAPALAAGRWVICDRFTDSTRAYQGAASGINDEVILAIDRIAVGVVQPDLTIVLDLAADAGLRRADVRRTAGGAGAARDTFEARTIAFHERIRDGFLNIAKREPQRCAVVDASKTPDDVGAEIWAAVSARLGVA